jgi:hypothetical protein
MAQKNWHEFELKPIKLILVPYFLFNYHYFIEDSGDGKKTVKSTVHGILAIDGHDIEVREDLVELLKVTWKKAIAEVPRGQFDEKWCNIEKKEQEEVIQLKTAEWFEVPKQNVVISSPRKFFVPFYKTSVIVEEKEYSIIVNAIDGALQGVKEIPEREKGYIELTRETVSELKHPSNWIKYSREALEEGTTKIVDAARGGKEKPLDSKKKSKGWDFSWLDSKPIWLMIIILALLLIFIGIFRIHI